MPSTRNREGALGRAIQEGDHVSVETLLAKGTDIEASVLCPDGTAVSPLMLAAMCGETTSAGLLLRAGAELDRRCGSSQETALLMCVSCGWEGTAKRLIDAGADIHLADDCGRSPLLMSCLMCHPECTEVLLEAGADTEQAMTSINSGATALYAACIGRRCECCSFRCASLLCEAGAVIDARTAQGATPMMAACQHGRHQLACLLSSYGASRLPARFEGDLPKKWWARDLADGLGHDELVEWLDASDEFTPLHHIEVLTPRRTLALLRAGEHSPVAGHPSPALRAKNYLKSFPHDEAAKMIVRASEPWAPATHSVWAEQHRARAFDLLKIGYSLRARLGDGSVLDWWVTLVMPNAIVWGVKPPTAPCPSAMKREQRMGERIEELATPRARRVARRAQRGGTR